MTEIFEKNIKAMEKWYPDFAEEVRNQDKKAEEEGSGAAVREEVSWDGERIYRMEKDGRKLYLNGKRNAGGAAALWRERLGELHKHAAVLLVGLGSGIYLKELCRSADDTVSVLVYEPSMEIFLHTLNHVDLSGYLEGRLVVWIVEGISGEGARLFLSRLVTLENVRYFKAECHPGYRELFPKEVLSVLKTAEEVTGNILIQQNTRSLFAGRAAGNQIRNMRYLVEGYNTLGLMRALPEGAPAVLVAAGPSLNKNIKELKRAKGRAFILAVDTALKPLLREGVIPDAFITIDGKKPLDLVDVEEAGDIPVIAPATANTELLKRQRGKKIFYAEGSRLPLDVYAAAGKELPDVATGGSVACSGLSLLHKMRFPTIILVGQDLAYTGGKSHADGTFKDVMPEENTKGMILVKGNYEEKVPTLTNLRKYLQWFGHYIIFAKETGDLRVINATEGGAWIEGTEVMSLHEALEEVCTGTADFEGAVRDMEPDFTDEERQKAIDHLFGLSKGFLELKKEAGQLEAAYRKMGKLSRSRTVDAKVYQKLLKRIKKLNRRCESGAAYDLVSDCMPLAEYILRTESVEELEDAEDEINSASRQGVKYARLIQECAQLLHDFMQEELKDAAYQTAGEMQGKEGTYVK